MFLLDVLDCPYCNLYASTVQAKIFHQVPENSFSDVTIKDRM